MNSCGVMDWGSMVNRGSVMNLSLLGQAQIMRSNIVVNWSCMMDRSFVVDWSFVMDWSSVVDWSSVMHRGGVMHGSSMVDCCFMVRTGHMMDWLSVMGGANLSMVRVNDMSHWSVFLGLVMGNVGFLCLFGLWALVSLLCWSRFGLLKRQIVANLVKSGRRVVHWRLMDNSRRGVMKDRGLVNSDGWDLWVGLGCIVRWKFVGSDGLAVIGLIMVSIL